MYRRPRICFYVITQIQCGTLTSVARILVHYLYTALFMYDYYSNRLPLIFDNFFKSINKVHQYQTRLASKISYYLPKARTNYGKFNIRFFGAKVWNSIDDSLKSKSRDCFKIS